MKFILRFITLVIIWLSLAITPAISWTHGRANVFNGGFSEVNFGDNELLFLNALKSAQNPGPVNGGWTNPDATTGFDFDTNGYARRIEAGSGGWRSLVVIPTDAERSWSDVSSGTVGAYTFDWDGGGTIYISGFTLVSGSLTSAPGSTGNLITLRPTTNRPLIGATAVTSSTDYPRNMRLYYTTDQAQLNAGKILSTKLRERWAAMKIGMVRYLNWQAGGGGNGNLTMLTNWASRKPVGHFSWSADEMRTAIYAGETTTPGAADHYVLSFNDPVYGTAAAVDKQMIHAKWNASQVGTRSYLDYNGRENLICNPFGSPADPTSTIANTGVPYIGMYTTLIYDSLLECWLNFSSGNGAPASTYLNNGVPPEIQLRAAIELGAHPWFLTPTYAADAGTSVGSLTDFSSNQIDMVRASAPSWMIPTYEPPNEWWNTIFRVYSWSNARQLVRNGGPIPGQTSAPFQVTSITYGTALSITGTGAGAGGKVRLTVSSTASLATGEIRTVSLVGGTVEANGVWPITVIDGTHIDLDGSTFVNAWTSGGSLTGQTVMQASGTLPPLGASLTGLNNQPSGLNGFNTPSGSVTSVGASSFTFDATPTSGSWAGNSSAATITLVGSTVSVTYTTADRNAIVLTTTGTLPAPLVADTVYYVRTGGAGGTPFQIALTPGGAAIDFSAGSQSGTHTGVQVLALGPSPQDYHNTYGTSASNLGQLLATKYGIADPKTQTSYRMAIGVQGGLANYYPTNTAGSDPRATSKNRVITSGDPSHMAKFWASHVTPANYFHMAAYGSGAQETTLANAWNGTLFTAGIVNGVMTVASFQNAGTQNMAAGQVVFGYGLPAPFGASQVTIVSGPAGCTTTCTGTGDYILSDNTINVASGTQLYSGASYAAVQEYIDSTNSVEVTATISNGSGGSGNQMVVSAISPIGVGQNATIYVNSLVRGSPITAATAISSQSSGTTGSTGTYIINRNHLVAAPTTFTINGSFGLQQVDINLTNWKTWAQSFDINKMIYYEGGYSPDYSSFNTASNFPKLDLLRYATKWALSSTTNPTGIAGMLAQNYAYIDAMNSASFEATFPSTYYIDGRYPSNNAWAVWENIYFPLTPPQVQTITDYNN